MRVLVTRPQAQAATWVQRLRERGIDAHALPLIGIAPAADAAAVQSAWHALPGYRLAMFVSPNAAEQFLAVRPHGQAWPAGVRAASPGPGTSEALLHGGVPAEAVAAPPADAPQFDSEALWQVLEHEDWHGARVLVVRGGDGAAGSGREWLADTLRGRGAQVDFVAAYSRTAPAWDAAADALLRRAVLSPGEHLWLFSSSEAIGHLLARLAELQLGLPGSAWSACATHARIAQAAQAAGFGRVLSCAPPFDDVLACVASAAKDPSIQSTAAAPSVLPVSPVTDTASPAAAAAVADPSPPGVRPGTGRKTAWAMPVAVVALLAVAASVWLAWSAQQRVHGLEQELVRRQQDSQGEATEARVLAKQAQDVSRETAAKAALLEARVAEVALQRGQLEELIQSLSRSRDENLVVDIEAGLRVALQQTAITGSAEPLVAALKSADERLVRVNQPRLEGVRRAIARDLDRVKAVGVADISTLVIKLDEVVRLVDELPLLSTAGDVETKSASSAPSRSQRAAGARAGASAPAAPASAAAGWREQLQQWWSPAWNELRSLVRVTRIDAPEAMLIAPEQGFFLRENLKLKLLNARLALLSRQFDTSQSDVQAALAALNRYFDGSSRKTTVATELLRQVSAQSRQGGVPRPDDTLAALAAAAAGR